MQAKCSSSRWKIGLVINGWSVVRNWEQTLASTLGSTRPDGECNESGGSSCRRARVGGYGNGNRLEYFTKTGSRR